VSDQMRKIMNLMEGQSEPLNQNIDTAISENSDAISVDQFYDKASALIYGIEQGSVESYTQKVGKQLLSYGAMAPYEFATKVIQAAQAKEEAEVLEIAEDGEYFANGVIIGAYGIGDPNSAYDDFEDGINQLLSFMQERYKSQAMREVALRQVASILQIK